VICLLDPGSLLPVLAGQVIKSLGLIPAMFLMPVLLSDVMDDVAAENGIRCDGFLSSMQSCVHTLTAGAAACILNIGMGMLGYASPAPMTVQSASVQSFFVFCAIGCQLFACPLGAFLLMKMNGRAKRGKIHTLN